MLNKECNISATSEFELATVYRMEKGQATLIRTKTGEEYAVSATASHVPYVQQHDEVLFFHSEQGAIIIAVLAQFEPWWRNTVNGLQIKCGASELQLQPTGNIKITTPHGQLNIDEEGELNMKTRQDIRLNSGRHIHLNCEET